MKQSKIMKKVLAIYILIVLFGYVGANAQSRTDEIRQALLNRTTEQVLVVSHRGDWRNAPENSLAAIENCIKMGVDIVELDVAKTKDGQLILMHDRTLDRTTTGKGAISEWTLSSIRTLKLKNGCNIRTKHSVPTLEEAMLVAKGRIMVNLDKSYDIFDEVYAILEKTGTTDQVIMKGKQPVQRVKSEFSQYLDNVLFMPIIDLDKDDALQQIEDYMKEMQPVAFELLYADKANQLPQKIPAMLKGKSLIWYNTLWDTLCGGHDDDMALDDIDGAYGYLINTLGARILQTDRPAMMLDYLKQR